MIKKVNLEIEVDEKTNKPVIVISYNGIVEKIHTTFKNFNNDKEFDNIKKNIKKKINILSRKNKIKKLMKLNNDR